MEVKLVVTIRDKPTRQRGMMPELFDYKTVINGH